MKLRVCVCVACVKGSLWRRAIKKCLHFWLGGDVVIAAQINASKSTSLFEGVATGWTTRGSGQRSRLQRERVCVCVCYRRRSRLDPTAP